MPHFLFATSCTLEAPFNADAVITGYGLKALPVDYSQKNFFPAVSEAPDMNYGLFLQSASVYYGKGRVLTFTDSTVFSNFWMFMPGKPELALGAVEWLNRANRVRYVSGLFGGVGLLGLVFIWYRFNGKKNTTLALLCSFLVAIPLSFHGYGAFNRMSYPLPQAHKQFTRVCFEQEHSDFALPTTRQTFAEGMERQFLTFYVWNQRLNYVPALETSLETALKKGDVMVLINPRRSFDERDKSLITTFVERGGKILVLESLGNREPVSNQLLNLFGLHIDFMPLKDSTVIANGRTIILTGQACSVAGGEVVLKNSAGEPVYARAKKGAGTVAVFTDSNLFSSAVMGDTSMAPTAAQQAIGKLEFSIMQGLVEGQPGILKE
jgi:hypothetical protein